MLMESYIVMGVEMSYQQVNNAEDNAAANGCSSTYYRLVSDQEGG